MHQCSSGVEVVVEEEEVVEHGPDHGGEVHDR